MGGGHVMGTFCTNRISRLAQWLWSETIRDWSFLPRGFDSLRISTQNSSQIQSPGRGCESASLWTRGSISVCGVHRTVAPPSAMQVPSPWPGILFMRVPDPGSVGITLYGYYHARLQLLDFMDRYILPRKLASRDKKLWWILHWDTEGIEPTREGTPISSSLRP